MKVRTIALIGLLLIQVNAKAGPGERPTDQGRKIFQEKVVPQLVRNGCPKCHAVGYLRPNVLNYGELLRRLAIGDSPVNNAVIYKIANVRSISPNVPNHPGGQRCPTLDSEPCRSIRAWWKIEFGEGDKP